MGENSEIVKEVIENTVENTIDEAKKGLDIQADSILGKIDEFVAEKILPVIVNTVNDVIGKEVIPKIQIKEGKKTSIKDWFQTPQISISAIAVFICIVIWNIVSNSTLFTGDYAIVNMCVTFGSYFFIMALKRKSGIDETGIFSTLRSIIDIVISKDSNDDKIKRLESVLLVITRELGELYEDELDKITTYLKSKQE